MAWEAVSSRLLRLQSPCRAARPSLHPPRCALLPLPVRLLLYRRPDCVHRHAAIGLQAATPAVSLASILQDTAATAAAEAAAARDVAPVQQPVAVGTPRREDNALHRATTASAPAAEATAAPSTLALNARTLSLKEKVEAMGKNKKRAAAAHRATSTAASGAVDEEEAALEGAPHTCLACICVGPPSEALTRGKLVSRHGLPNIRGGPVTEYASNQRTATHLCVHLTRVVALPLQQPHHPHSHPQRKCLADLCVDERREPCCT